MRLFLQGNQPCMKRSLLLLLLLPLFSYSQSKRKKRIAEEKANAALVTSLTKHVQYLADDKLEGRRSGSNGEKLAMQYIIDQYTAMGLEPKGTNGYIQEFDIEEGKQIDPSTSIMVDGKKLALLKEYIPLAYSASVKLQGSPAMALTEPGQPWFIDLKETLEENKNNPHFEVDAAIKEMAAKVAAKKGTALFVYNTSGITDNVQYNKNDKSTAETIPVIFITKEGYEKYFTDNSATLHISLQLGFSEKKRTARNIIGFINNHAANTVILGAHYDHLGYGEDKTALDTGHLIHNGADDNASGTAALIELTRMLKQKSPLHNNYLIINFSGEEQGLLGSKYWLEHPTTRISPNYMINMDMVGRYDTAHKLTIGGYGTSPVWPEVFASEKTALSIVFDSTGSGPSDHAAFYRKDIPVLFLFTGSHNDYHKATDDWDKINYEGEKDIVKLLYEIIGITDTKNKLPFTKTAEQKNEGRRSFKVTLGVIPDYGFTGTGMRIDGVSAGKPGEKAGLKAGDIILQLGEYKFVDIYSYMEALGKFDKGDKTTIRIKRGTEEKIFDIVF
jgi:Zn-dependent M28 family amino/carboxypeptidase